MASHTVSGAVLSTGASRFCWRRWFVTVTLGEAVGFAIPGAAWAAAWQAELPPMLLYAAVAIAGAGEGAVPGFAQAGNVERLLPGIKGVWVARTALAAAVAWAVGMAPSTSADLGVPAWLPPALAAAGALPVLGAIGLAQWTVLRRRVPNAGRWIVANVGAWLAGLPVTFIAPALVPERSPWHSWALAFAIAGLVMAMTIAAITGAAMGRLLGTRTVAAPSGWRRVDAKAVTRAADR